MLILLPAHALANDDFQIWLWSSISNVQKEKWNLKTHGQIRFVEDASRVGLYLVSEKFSYTLHPHLQLGLNYTHIESRVKNKKTRKTKVRFQNRYEIEANPHWSVFKKGKAMVRNRMEFRVIENQGSDNTRFRQRWGMTLPPLFINAEFFYDMSHGEYNENRIIPIGLRFGWWDVFYLIQSQKKSSWITNHTLGTNISVKF